MQIRVFGAAGEVTGSCYLVQTDRARLLLDFGLHQGGADADKRNRNLPPIAVQDLDAVVLTHAHLDHSGRTPLLAREGYRGPIYATPATIDLCEILLKDAAHLQQLDAERSNRRHAGARHAEPLYTGDDVERLLPRFEPAEYDHPVEVAPGITCRWVDAGHILGSASVEMICMDGGATRTIVFSGDIGPRGAPLLKDPVTFDRADLVFLESTYGDRDHRSMDDSLDEFVSIIESAQTPEGKVIIPAFAVGRTQQLLYFIGELRRQGRLTEPRVYMDSPMAITTTDLYCRHKELFDKESRAILEQRDSCLHIPGLRIARTPQESMAINRLGDGVIVLSASGMCTGGRILHHLKNNLWKEQAHLLIVGFQAQGTLGRRLVDGQKNVSIMGEPIRVKAHVHTLGGFSAHAGQTELLEWLTPIAPSAPRVMLTHGENEPRKTLSDLIERELRLTPELPEFGDTIEL